MHRALLEAEPDTEQRQAILEASGRVLSLRGFSEATVADVARVSGQSYGTICTLYPTKESLLVGLLDATASGLRARVAAALDGLSSEDRLDPEPVLRTATRETLRFFERDRAVTHLLLCEVPTIGPGPAARLDEIVEGFVDDVASVLDECEQTGRVRNLPIRLVSLAYVATVMQLAARRARKRDGYGATDVADVVVTTFLDGLLP